MELLPSTRPQSWSHGLVGSEGRNHLMTAKVKILSIFMFISKPLRGDGFGVIVPSFVRPVTGFSRSNYPVFVSVVPRVHIMYTVNHALPVDQTGVSVSCVLRLLTYHTG